MEQLTLNYESGISRRHKSLLSLCAARMYRHGLENTAADIDMAPSNLSVALTGRKRKLGVDKLELYMEKTQDLEPIFYLIDKFLKNEKSLGKAQVLNQCSTVLQECQAMLRKLDESAVPGRS